MWLYFNTPVSSTGTAGLAHSWRRGYHRWSCTVSSSDSFSTFKPRCRSNMTFTTTTHKTANCGNCFCYLISWWSLLNVQRVWNDQSWFGESCFGLPFSPSFFSFSFFYCITCFVKKCTGVPEVHAYIVIYTWRRQPVGKRPLHTRIWLCIHFFIPSFYLSQKWPPFHSFSYNFEDSIKSRLYAFTLFFFLSFFLSFFRISQLEYITSTLFLEKGHKLVCTYNL